MASNVAPPAGGGGGAAAAVGSAALHAGQRGAAIAQKGVVNLTIYVQRLQKKPGKKGVQVVQDIKDLSNRIRLIEWKFSKYRDCCKRL